jgi:hypothetical protein
VLFDLLHDVLIALIIVVVAIICILVCDLLYGLGCANNALVAAALIVRAYECYTMNMSANYDFGIQKSGENSRGIVAFRAQCNAVCREQRAQWTPCVSQQVHSHSQRMRRRGSRCEVTN